MVFGTGGVVLLRAEAAGEEGEEEEEDIEAEAALVNSSVCFLIL